SPSTSVSSPPCSPAYSSPKPCATPGTKSSEQSTSVNSPGSPKAYVSISSSSAKPPTSSPSSLPWAPSATWVSMATTGASTLKAASCQKSKSPKTSPFSRCKATTTTGAFRKSRTPTPPTPSATSSSAPKIPKAAIRIPPQPNPCWSNASTKQSAQANTPSAAQKTSATKSVASLPTRPSLPASWLVLAFSSILRFASSL